jgi:hypothetical protein
MHGNPLAAADKQAKTAANQRIIAIGILKFVLEISVC